MPQPVFPEITRPSGPSPWLQYLGPLVLTLLAWTYFAGSLTHRVDANEAAIAEQKETNKSFPTREESRISNESVLRELNAIHEDVRAIKKNVEDHRKVD